MFNLLSLTKNYNFVQCRNHTSWFVDEISLFFDPITNKSAQVLAKRIKNACSTEKFKLHVILKIDPMPIFVLIWFMIHLIAAFNVNAIFRCSIAYAHTWTLA